MTERDEQSQDRLWQLSQTVYAMDSKIDLLIEDRADTLAWRQMINDHIHGEAKPAIAILNGIDGKPGLVDRVVSLEQHRMKREWAAGVRGRIAAVAAALFISFMSGGALLQKFWPTWGNHQP